MKTTHFTTLEQLFEASKEGQITAQKIINLRAHINGEHQNFTISHELKSEIMTKICEVLAGRKNTKEAMFYQLMNATPQHWGLDRIILSKYSDYPPRFSYCAGQDYPSELSQIRKYLNK